MKRLKPILLPFACFLAICVISPLKAQDTAKAEADTSSETTSESEISAAKGEKLYQEHDCNTCHKINQELVGPALAGVNERRPTDWLVRWIQNSQKVIESGDEYANNLFQEYNQTVMPPAAVNEKEVKSILAYIERETKKAQDAQAASGGGDSGPLNIYSEGSIMNDSTFKTLLTLSILLLFVLLITSINILIKFLRLNGSLPNVNWFKVNAYLLALFFIASIVGIIYEFNIHTQYLLPEAASEHGKNLDQLFLITLIITGFVFIVTQFLLFFFSFKYQGKKGSKGLYYPVNDKLEVFWTTIPTIALAVLIILGFISWRNITSPPKDSAQVIEVFAYQFNWKFRYPGEDGKLGKADFTRIEPGKNPLGLNPDDPNSQDDIITSELRLPVDQQVIFEIRSRDVIHSAYLPHFRVQMYAQPGMDNTFKFTPTISTKEMKKKVDNEDFQYELACNQICGAAHYNMKADVVVQKPDTMQQWLSEQQTFQKQMEQFAEK